MRKLGNFLSISFYISCLLLISLKIAFAEKPPIYSSLTLIPPSPVSDKINLSVRGAVNNQSSSAVTIEAKFYLDEIKQSSLLHLETLEIPARAARGVYFRWGTKGHRGDHRILFAAESIEHNFSSIKPLTIYASENRSSEMINGAWSGFYMWGIEGLLWNDELVKMTDDQWCELVRAMNETGMNLLVVQEMFRNHQYVDEHKIDTEGYQGKAYYPSALFPGRMDIESKDPLEAILSEADKLGMHVFVPVGLYAWFDFSDGSLQWHKKVASELWERYGHHKSFYGWYVSEEIHGWLTPEKKDTAKMKKNRRDIVHFFKEFKAHVRRMAPDKPVMLASNSHYVDKALDTYPKLLEHLDILCPFGFHRMPEDDMTGEQAAELLQKLCDESGTHLWMDLEAFLFGEQKELYPRPIQGLISDLTRFPDFEKILCFQFSGLFNAPWMSRKPGGEATVKLYRDYKQYYDNKKSDLDMQLRVKSNVLPEPRVVWEYDSGEALVATPVFYPSVNDPQSILILTASGKMISVDQKGGEIWRHDFGEPVQATPAIGDLDDDGIQEIVTATVAGKVVVLSGSGKEQGRYPLAGRVIDWASPCLADLNGDGTPEILIGDEAGWMNALSGEGRRLWRVKTDVHTTSTPAIVPGPDGSVQSIIYGNENDHIVALDARGGLRWLIREEGQYGRNNPTVGDLDGDGDYEVIVHTSFNNPKSRLLALDANDGQVIWQAKLNLHGYVSNAIADIDGDGQNEVLLAMRSNTIYCFDGNGKERWHTVTGGNAFFWTPAVADINGDGRCEIIAGVRRTNERSKSWFVLNDQGQLLGEYEMPGGANAAPLVADLDRDNQLDIILPGSDKGLLRCLTFGGPAQGARMEWISHRYDAARSGYKPADIISENAAIVKKLPLKLETTWTKNPDWGENTIKVSLPIIKSKRIVIEVVKENAFDSRESILYDKDNNDLPDEISIELAAAGQHMLTIRIWNPSDWRSPIAEWKDKIELSSLQKYTKLLQQKLNLLPETAQQILSSNPALSQLLQERFAQRQGTVQQLYHRFRDADFSQALMTDIFLEADQQFNNLIEQDMVLAKIAEQAVSENQRTLVVWEDSNPWNEKTIEYESQKIASTISVEIPLYRNEYESRAITIVNLRPQPIDVQIRRDEESRQSMQIYEMLNVPRQDGTWVGDALADLNTAQTIHLAGGEFRQIWLTVYGDSDRTESGKIALGLVPLGWEQDKIKIEIDRQIIPLDLSKAPLFYVCNWSSSQMLEHTGIDPAKISEARAHGINVFVLGLPPCYVDEKGERVGETDWAIFDRHLALLDEGCFLLIPGGEISIPEKVERFGPVHLKAQKKWFTQIRNHLQEKGWSIERWALYPVDEPGLFGGTMIKRFIEIAHHFKQAMPDVQIYANPAGFVTTENMREMVPLVDVWSPEQALMRRQPELAPFFLNTGKQVWSYEAPPEVKSLLPLGYYRANSWMAFQLGLSGTGFWTQYYGDLWLKKTVVDYGANYVAGTHEIISRRWEAFRDGIEDVGAFRLLQQAILEAITAGKFDDLVTEAEKLLGSEISPVTEIAWSANDITRFLRDYEMDYDKILDVRKRVAMLTLQLRKHNQ